MEGQGTFFPGHKQKQGRSGPFSRELPRSWEHGGARQASPTCPARQLARTLPLPWAPRRRVSSAAVEAPRSRLAAVHSSLAALTWDAELPCSGKQGATLLSAQSPGMTQGLSRGGEAPILCALCCWLSGGSSREDGGRGQRKQYSLPLPLTTVIPCHPQAASEGPGRVLGAPAGNLKPSAAQGA